MTSTSAALGVLRFVWNHPANHGKRIRCLVRAARYQARARLGQPTLITVGHQAKMRVWPRDPAASKALYANPPDWNEMWAWRRLLRRGNLFIDVGANVGAYSLWVAQTGVRTIAVEPSPTAAARLRANVGLNQFPIAIQQCALAEQSGHGWLTRDLGPTNHLLVGPDQGGDHIPVRTLDELLGDGYASGVKIDVEGAERLVLAGATRALRERRIGVIQLEWNAMSQRLLGEDRTSVADLLSGYGYRFARPDADGVLHPAVPEPMSGRDLFAVSPVEKRDT